MEESYLQWNKQVELTDTTLGSMISSEHCLLNNLSHVLAVSIL